MSVCGSNSGSTKGEEKAVQTTSFCCCTRYMDNIDIGFDDLVHGVRWWYYFVVFCCDVAGGLIFNKYGQEPERVSV